METLGFAEERPSELVEKPQNHEIPDDDFAVDDTEGDQATANPSWKKTA